MIDFEVWLSANGKSLGLWYSSRDQVFGTLSSEGKGLAPNPDGRGLLKRIVLGARPEAVPGAFRASARAFSDGPVPPATLARLCSVSDVIAVGRVVAVLRNEHSPIGANGYEQHTVYIVSVGDYLKRDNPSMPPILKVWQKGGRLPWVNFDSSAKGVGWEVASDPMPRVGQRYILFLHGFGKDIESRKVGYVPATVNGVRGKDAELDEYRAVEPIRGKILLRDGLTRLPMDPGSPGYHVWSFESGPQILSVREQDAIEAIRKSALLPALN